MHRHRCQPIGHFGTTTGRLADPRRSKRLFGRRNVQYSVSEQWPDATAVQYLAKQQGLQGLTPSIPIIRKEERNRLLPLQMIVVLLPSLILLNLVVMQISRY